MLLAIDQGNSNTVFSICAGPQTLPRPLGRSPMCAVGAARLRARIADAPVARVLVLRLHAQAFLLTRAGACQLA